MLNTILDAVMVAVTYLGFVAMALYLVGPLAAAIVCSLLGREPKHLNIF